MDVTSPIGITDTLHIRPLSIAFDYPESATTSRTHEATIVFEIYSLDQNGVVNHRGQLPQKVVVPASRVTGERPSPDELLRDGSDYMYGKLIELANEIRAEP